MGWGRCYGAGPGPGEFSEEADGSFLPPGVGGWGRLSGGRFRAGGSRGSGRSGLSDWSRVAVCPLCPQTINELKGRISELQWSVMNQEVQLKGLESEKQELQEQLDLQRR